MKFIFNLLFLSISFFFATNALSVETSPESRNTQKVQSLSGDPWNVGLPRFSFPFSGIPYEEHHGGRSKQAGSYNFSVSTNMANVLMELDPGAIRELHWHAEAAEWAYVISGQTRITLTSPDGKTEVADVNEGGIWYFPKGWGHSIQNVGTKPTQFVLVLNNGNFTEQSTFSVTDWISHTPLELLTKGLQISESTANKFPKSDGFMFTGSVNGINGAKQNTKSDRSKRSHVFELYNRKDFEKSSSGSIKLVTAKDFPASFNISSGLMRIEPNAIRGLHWHPNADEWHMVLDGEMELVVFASGGKASIERLSKGDVGYIPKGYGHALRNLSPSKPVELLVVFNSGDYQSINLVEWLSTTPAELVNINLQTSGSDLGSLPQTNPVFEGRR